MKGTIITRIVEELTAQPRYEGLDAVYTTVTFGIFVQLIVALHAIIAVEIANFAAAIVFFFFLISG